MPDASETPEPVVRDAAAADLDRCCDTLARSHRDHPWDRWALTGDVDPSGAPADEVEAGLRRLIDAWFRLLILPGGRARVADDALSVAVWIPHDADPPGDDAAEALADIAGEVLGDRATIVAAAEAQVRARRPPGPHVVLASLGTDPAHQGRGLASALLANQCARFDDDEITAAVETSSARNVAFYERFGFAVTAEVTELPDDGPTTWVLTRQPA